MYDSQGVQNMGCVIGYNSGVINAIETQTA